jgi:hypothetical protein
MQGRNFMVAFLLGRFDLKNINEKWGKTGVD